MKRFIFGLSFISALGLASCIQDEPLNSECDIEMATVVTDNAEALFYSATQAVKEVPSADTTIVFNLREEFLDKSHPEWESLKNMAVNFKLTPGATITPENGSAHDFTQEGGVRYTITSEDGAWHRNYHVIFVPTQRWTTEFHFEDFRWVAPKNKYREWFEYSEDGSAIDLWVTGNPAFSTSRSSASPEEYPTIPYDNAVDGKGVKLETCSTGIFGMTMNMRIAAGNLFVGTFDAEEALRGFEQAMAATRFGLPFNKRPVSFNGYYKYKAGEKFINRMGTEQPGRVDEPDLYAVLYDNEGQSFTLQGDNVLNHPNIVAIARVTGHTYVKEGEDIGTAEWNYFDIPFEYYKEIEKNKLDAYGYNLAVVFTSSIEGAMFCGAVGSTLLVDEVNVICEDEEK